MGGTEKCQRTAEHSSLYYVASIHNNLARPVGMRGRETCCHVSKFMLFHFTDKFIVRRITDQNTLAALTLANIMFSDHASHLPVSNT